MDGKQNGQGDDTVFDIQRQNDAGADYAAQQAQVLVEPFETRAKGWAVGPRFVEGRIIEQSI